MPKITFDTRDAIPKGLEAAATEEGGKWVIDVSPTSAVVEMREKLETATAERDTLRAAREATSKLIGEDPEAFRSELSRLRAVDQSVKDGKLKGTDAITAEVEARVRAAREQYDEQVREANRRIEQAEAQAKSLDGKLRNTVIQNYISQAALAGDSPINPSAIPDILARAQGVWHVTDDDKIVPKKGDAVLYGADGVNPMSAGEWLNNLIKEAPHFAKPSKGGGSGGDTKRYGGMSEEQFLKLSPVERLRLARKQEA